MDMDTVRQLLQFCIVHLHKSCYVSLLLRQAVEELFCIFSVGYLFFISSYQLYISSYSQAPKVRDNISGCLLEPIHISMKYFSNVNKVFKHGMGHPRYLGLISCVDNSGHFNLR